MPLEKEKLKAEKKRYALISSGMFVMLLALIGVLVYVSVSNVKWAREIEKKDSELQTANADLQEKTIALEIKQKELEFANLALKTAELNYKNFVDSIIKEGTGVQKQKAMEVKQHVNHLSDKISKDEQTQKDLAKIEELGDVLDGDKEKWTPEQIKEKEQEYEEIQRRNPVVDAVVRANEELGKKESEIAQQIPQRDSSEKSITNRVFKRVVSERGEWLKEGYFRTYKEANGLKIYVDGLRNGEAKITCSFPEKEDIPAWTFNLKEGERRTFNKGNIKILISFQRTGAAGKNPLKKAMFYNLAVAKRS